MDLTAFDLKGKVALVTGGAHGIGFSIAEGMAKCGATVCFNCSNEGSLEKGLAAYKAAGIDAHGYVADVTDEAAVNAMIAQIKADVGPVDILVNNAGLMKRVPMIEMSHTDFLRVIDVHVGGAFNCSKAVLPDICLLYTSVERDEVIHRGVDDVFGVSDGQIQPEEPDEVDHPVSLIPQVGLEPHAQSLCVHILFSYKITRRIANILAQNRRLRKFYL